MMRAEHLEAIKTADKAYYEDDKPNLSDAAYDELRNDYIEKYGSADLDYTPGSVSEGFASFHHPIPVTSLAKIKAGETAKLHKWREKLSPVVLEPKYDGLTIVAYPQKDGSYKFVTRGSGTDGEVLPNFMSRYEGTDQVLDGESKVIRGEVMLRKATFKDIQADQRRRGEEPFKNIRNAAAGILRSKERSRYLDMLTYVCYDVVGWDVSEKRKLGYIRQNTPFEATMCSDDYVIDTSDDYVWERAKTIFNKVGEDLPLDGIVMKTLKDGALAELGSTGHHVNTAVALKPSRQIFETTLRDIEFSIGRTKITPVAIFDPVEIDGTEVSRASIHNKDYFDKLALCSSDTLFIYKSNEIIPQIESVIHNGGTPFQWPDESVGSSDVLVRDIMHMVSKSVLDIKGFSEATARKLVGLGLVKERNDIFYLEPSAISSLHGFGDKSARKIADQIDARRDDLPFPRFVRALCIPGIGAHVGEAIENAFPSFDAFVSFLNSTAISQQEKLEQLKAVDGIGPETADEIVTGGFGTALTNLRGCLRSISWKQEAAANASPVSGKSFVLTGRMEHPRSHYEERIKKAGGIVQSAVSSKTDYLVIADTSSTSSKAQKARKLGTKLVSPEELERML